MITADFPQSEIAATNFYDSGGSLGEELGEELVEDEHLDVEFIMVMVLFSF